jgi:hypothetical protein
VGGSWWVRGGWRVVEEIRAGGSNSEKRVISGSQEALIMAAQVQSLSGTIQVKEGLTTRSSDPFYGNAPASPPLFCFSARSS